MSASYLKTRSDLAREIARLGLAVPVADEIGALLQPFPLGGCTVPNRLCALPLAGDDADPGGSPSAYTVRRYQRTARGGFGMIWMEATEVVPCERLSLHDGTVEAFARLVAALRESAPDALLILQLWPPADGREPEGVVEGYVRASRLAATAGFDGVDVACCHGNALSRGLAGSGEALPERAAPLRRIVQGIRASSPALLMAVRLDAYHARAHGFGVDAGNYRRMDPAEPIELARMLEADGVDLLSITAGSPNLFGDPACRAREPIPDGGTPHEHPLTVLARHQDIGREFREAAPGLTVVGGGYSWLRELALEAGAAAVEAGAVDVVGLGRLALLDPRAVAPSPGLCSLWTFAEADLWEEGGPFGRRPARTAAYRDDRLAIFDDVRALEGGEEFVSTFQAGRLEEAYGLIRESNPLPEMTSHIVSEASCDSEPALSLLNPGSLPLSGSPGGFALPAGCETIGGQGRANPPGEPRHATRDTAALRQLQYMIAWTARRRGWTGVRVPAEATGKRVAIIGGGPAGLAAATVLLEAGHGVVLCERANGLGGAPALVYPEDRVPDPSAEIETLLEPAVQAHRLTIDLGSEATPESLRGDYDAVLVATGCWNEPSLGKAEGVWPALRFLRAARRGDCTEVPRRVVLLCGGDAAMDAAVVAKMLGAERLDLLFDAPRQDAHWHLPESWFDVEGVEAHFEVRPTGYRVDEGGAVQGVHTEGHETIDTDMVIEAMGLMADAANTDPSDVFYAGAIVNGGASVEQCIHEGMGMATDIDRFVRGGAS